MKWSNQKCKKVALFATLIYLAIGIFILDDIKVIERTFPIEIAEIVIGIFYPIIMPIYAALWGVVLAFLIVPLSLFIVWLVFYGIIWLIKGEREKEK